MSANLIDGKKVAEKVLAEVKAGAEEFEAANGRPVGLAVVLVGEDPPSQLYVSSKEKISGEVGIRSLGRRLPASTSQAELEALVAGLNADEAVDGILVQLPLPKGLDEQAVLDLVSPEKDVDGLHPQNVGKLVRGDKDALVSCTPAGVMRLLDEHGVDPFGKRAVVIGRSDIVGKPMALLLLHRHATVTICHSRTQDLPALCREADILVAAVGRPFLVEKGWVKPGAVVVDVGMNRVPADRVPPSVLPWLEKSSAKLKALREKGAVLAGDVHPAVEEVASLLTPVPGGVGPMTIAMLMANALAAARGRKKGSA